MNTVSELYVRVNGQADCDNVKAILYKNHGKIIVNGIVEGQWENSPQEMLCVTIMDDEELIHNTVVELKQKFGLDHLPVVEDGDVSYH